MKKTIPLLASVAVELCLAAPLVAATARTATENFVTNKIAAAISQIPPPDFSTSNAALVETIEATAPVPGNYAAVSNAAMNALSRAEAEAGFTEWVITPTLPAGWRFYWDPIWNGDAGGEWLFEYLDEYPVPTWNTDPNATEVTAAVSGTTYTATRTRLPTMADIPTAQINAATTTNALQDTAIESLSDSISTLNDSISTLNTNVVHKTGDETIGGIKTFIGGHTVIPFIYAGQGSIEIGISGRISQATAGGLLNDAIIPNYGEVKSTITAAIREQSLGGIWDEELQVWWTPVMRNGSLTYQATTNVNLNAEN